VSIKKKGANDFLDIFYVFGISRVGILCWGPVCQFLPFMGQMLWLWVARGWMLEALKGVFDVSQNGNAMVAVVTIVPLNSEITVAHSSPVFNDGV
jgi:hypothetical protein